MNGSLASARGGRLPAIAVIATVALVAAYLALGGAGYKPLEVADPCDPRPVSEAQPGLLERIALSALDGAACELRVTREELALAIANPSERQEFAERYKLTDEAIERAVVSGLERAIDDAQSRGEISPVEATVLGELVEALPVSVVIDALQTSAGRSILELGQDLLGGVLG